MQTQLQKLENLIRAAERARIAAEHGLLFADRKGAALLNAIHDLIEVDGVYDLARDVERECRLEPLPRITTPVRKLDPAVWPELVK